MINTSRTMVCLSILFLLLGQKSAAAETSGNLACWNHYCEIDYERTGQFGDYFKILTKRKFCFRPHYKCVYSVDLNEKVQDGGHDFIGNADISCEANTGAAPLPDIYCASSFFRDCKCGHRAHDSMDEDDHYDYGGMERDETLNGKAIQAFCDCQLSVVGNLILVCVLVPIILLIVTACFLKVFGGCLGSLASSLCGRGKNGGKEKETEKNIVCENAIGEKRNFEGVGNKAIV